MAGNLGPSRHLTRSLPGARAAMIMMMMVLVTVVLIIVSRIVRRTPVLPT